MNRIGSDAHSVHLTPPKTHLNAKIRMETDRSNKTFAIRIPMNKGVGTMPHVRRYFSSLFYLITLIKMYRLNRYNWKPTDTVRIISNEWKSLLKVDFAFMTPIILNTVYILSHGKKLTRRNQVNLLH